MEGKACKFGRSTNLWLCYLVKFVSERTWRPNYFARMYGFLLKTNQVPLSQSGVRVASVLLDEEVGTMKVVFWLYGLKYFGSLRI